MLFALSEAGIERFWGRKMAWPAVCVAIALLNGCAPSASLPPRPALAGSSPSPAATPAPSAIPSPSPSSPQAPSPTPNPYADPVLVGYCTQGEAAVSGDRGYARAVAKRYRARLDQILSLSGAPATPVPVPTAMPTQAPLPTPTPPGNTDVSVRQTTTLNGRVYNSNHQLMENVLVKARSLNDSVPFEASTETVGGIFALNHVPAGLTLEISISKTGYNPRRRVEVLKSNHTGDPNANRFDFGNDGNDTTYGAGYLALNDLPEIIATVPGRNAARVGTLTDIVLTFRQPMERASVEDNLLIRRLVDSGEPIKAFVPSDFTVSWNAEDTQITLKLKADREFAVNTNYRVGFQPGSRIIATSGITRSDAFFQLVDGDNEAELAFGTDRFATPKPFEVKALSDAIPVMPTIAFEPVLLPRQAGAEQISAALQANRVPPAASAVTRSLLDLEPFDAIDQMSQPGGRFRVSLGVWKYDQPSQAPVQSTYEIGALVSAPNQCRQTRPPLNLTVLVNMSGRMQGAVSSAHALALAGLRELAGQLRADDRISLIGYADIAGVRFENQPGSQLRDALEAFGQLTPAGGANLSAGLAEAYKIAQAHFDASRLNRVLLLSDTQPEDGGIDLTLLKDAAARTSNAGIALDVLALGENRNPDLLRQLTQAGRGAALLIQTPGDMQDAINNRLLPLLNPVALNLRYSLELPAWMRQLRASDAEVPSPAGANIAAGSHFIWQQLAADLFAYQGDDRVRLRLSYQDPQSGAELSEVYEQPLSQLIGKQLDNIRAAHLIQLTSAVICQEIAPAVARAELDGPLGGVGE